MAVVYTARLCTRMAAYVGPKRSALEYGYNKPPLSSCKLRMKLCSQCARPLSAFPPHTDTLIE